MMNLLRSDIARVGLGAVLGLSLCVGGLSGCGKEEAPPPPRPTPPPPPPPEPDPLDMQAMLQSMNLDARVQVSEQVQVFDEEFGRAVLRFADAFARGDDDTLRESLDPSGREILEMLSADWSSEVESIEAVRLVAASAPVEDEGGFEEDPMEEITAESLRDMLLEVIDSGTENLDFEGVPPQALDQVRAQFEALRQNPEQARTSVNQMYDSGMLATMAQQMQQAVSQIAATSMTFAAGEPDVSLAIQQPGAAFLINFTVVPSGGRYLYIPTAGNDAVLTRASEWDDMQLGMNLQASLAEEIGDAPELGSAPETGSPGAPGDDDPLRRNTPRGPVTVPGGS